MAVSKFKKVYIIAHDTHKNDLLIALKELGVVEISVKTQYEKLKELEDIEAKSKIVKQTIEFLQKKIKTIAYPRDIDQTIAMDVISNFDVEHFYQRCLKAEQQHNEAKEKLNEVKNQRDTINRWRECFFDFSTKFNSVKILFCELKKAVWENFELEINREIKCLEIIWRKKVKDSMIFTAFVANDTAEQFINKLKKYDGIIHDLSMFKGTPLDILHEILGVLEENQTRINRYLYSLTQIVSEAWKVKLLYDYYTELYELKSTELSLTKTHDALIIEGWVLEKNTKKLKEKIQAISSEIEIYYRDPLILEDPPVILENLPIFKPFEFITTMYGKPRYFEPDPTPLLAPFFTIFFGLCLSDVFYGILLLVFCVFIITSYELSKESLKLIKILMLCGVSAFIAGILTNSCVGISFSKYIPWSKNLAILNPLVNPTQFMFMAFILGITHIILGIIIKGIKEVKSGKIINSISSFIWVPMIVSLTPLVYRYIFGMKTDERILQCSRYAVPFLILSIIIISAMKTKNPLLKPFSWIINLYSVVGYFGDVLSYTRLLALALAGMVIAQIVNEIASLILKTNLYQIELVFAFLVFIGGHIFNFVINCLGAFVHSMRLQYVEFFQKFFEGGGKDFLPFERKLPVPIYRLI